ncbi:MAG: SDR family NAD(P)-dependent oxidoreductase [Phycisphaerales bacterium]
MPTDPKHPRPVAIVTGAGSGIGLASARGLAGAGFDLLLVGRREGPLRAAIEGIRAETAACAALAFPADVAETANARRIVDACLDRFGRIDCLVNNAGLAPLLPIDRTTPEVLHEVFAVNAVGPGALIAACWPTFLAQRSGRVVNISTMGTADPFPGFFAYAAAKAAVNSFARSIAKEGAEHGVRGFAIAPGAVETPMLRALFDEQAIPREATLTPETIAAIVVECATGARDAESGATIFAPNSA